jgi:alpha-glucosidase
MIRVIGLVIATAIAASAQTINPRVFLLDGKHLAATRQRAHKSHPAIAKLESDARKALTAGPFTVTSKAVTPPSGDKRDYLSQAPYFWRDPKTPNGLPYIRRDGERNPEIDKHTDHRVKDQMEAAVETLALAYYFSANEEYAARATELLRVFFLNSETRMNPNLGFAQGIPGINTGRGIGLIETRGLTRVVDAIGLLAGSKAWTSADQRGMEKWYGAFLRWMLESKHGRDEAAAKNNHGTYYDVQVVSFALFTGNENLAKRVVLEARTKRIALQIEPDGSQPLELERTRAWSYSVGNLDGLMQLARLAENVGVDLWHYQTRDGRGIRKALDFLVPFALGDKKWAHQQLGEWPPQMLFALVRRAALRYDDPEFKIVLGRVPPTAQQDRTTLLRPDSVSRHYITSPNRKITFELLGFVNNRLKYRVLFNGSSVIEASELGITTGSAAELTKSRTIHKVRSYAFRETFSTRGVHSLGENHCNGAQFSIIADESYTLEVRAFNDGVAFRYIVAGDNQPRVPREQTAFILPSGSAVWFHDFQGHYEGVHARKEIAEVASGAWAAPPLTFKLPSGRGYASITEAALINYAGMGLRANGEGEFKLVLGDQLPVSYPFELRYKAEIERLSRPAAIAGEIKSPWRVVMIGADLNSLVNSDIIDSVSPAPDKKLFPLGPGTQWIKPGRAVWKYLDGGQNTLDGMKEFSRLAGELGFEYNVVEGFWQRWPEDQLRELVDYARQYKVGILLWKHSRDLRTPYARRQFFQLCNRVGAVGAKIDFFDHEAKEIIDLYQALLRDAAEHKILVNFHGANKPAGESRTWPNELTREAIRGLEASRMTERARHNTTLPFTRMLAGHADYTGMHFGERRRETSWSHQIASAAILTSPLLIYAAHPRNILDNPAREFIRTIPSTWDETIVLPQSEIGEVAAFSRRRGNVWFLAIMNGPTARKLTLPLAFLPRGARHATIVRDVFEDAASVKIESIKVNEKGFLEVDMRGGGGFVARFDPQNEHKRQK